MFKTSYNGSSTFLSVLQMKRNREAETGIICDQASGRHKPLVSWISRDLQYDKSLYGQIAIEKVMANKLFYNSLTVYEKTNKENLILGGKQNK